MAETFLFNIAEKVLGKVGSLAIQEVRLAWGVDGELKRLENTLSTILAVLLDAEEQQRKNRQLTVWLGNLKDAFYDVDDVLDEFQYEALRSQVVNRGGIRKKVRGVFSRSNPLAAHLRMGHKIKEIRQKLDEIAAEKTKFHLTERDVDTRVVHAEREITHSFVLASDVIGREEDKENIIKLLERPGDGENVSIIPIVGIGGLGKTTLAKLVYNDERVVKHFELKMWVYVSKDFDVTMLTKEIIKSAETGENCNDLTIDQLQYCLRRTLLNKKFLLILDDVWNEDRGKWIKLRDLLLGGANGSTIIVTTRSQSVASIVYTVPAYILEGLPHEHCLSLFVKWAFREGEEKQHPNLLKIGDEIVKKCRGVPLAVRTLGSLLYLKTDENDWLFVKTNEIWKFGQKEDDILPALRLSYDEMPSYLKQCFVCCSIFPRGYEFDNFKLIQFWMAQGLLHSSHTDRNLGDIGQQYLYELWSRSFLQDVEDHGTVLTFKMHDLVYDLALYVAQTECFNINNINFHTRDSSKRVRHISFETSQEEVPRFSLELNKVRTILFPVEGEGPTNKSFVETCISRFKYLRVLDLSDSCFKILPTSIGDLKHLRYLDLSQNRTIKKLPKTICKLQNLQTLLLEGCSGLEELPRDIGDLISLSCLDITTKQKCLPAEGIGSLISLRFLEFEGCLNLKSLGEGMQCLTALRTLAIVHCHSLEESLQCYMKYLPALETLAIVNCERLDLETMVDDMQDLRFNLRSLFISDLPQLVAFPLWLQEAANTLQNIHICGCSNLIALPWWLENLTSLKKLEIIDCPKMEILPDRLTALKELKIEDCPTLSEKCKRETGVYWSRIAHVREITLEGKRIK